jgi:hypothetical protein
MVIINSQSCIDSNEAHTIERGYIESLNATLNCVIPSRTREEWIEINKDKIKEQVAVYHELHKDHINDWLASYRQVNKEAIAEYNAAYREANKTQIYEQKKQYREANKEVIKANKKLAYEKKKLLKQESLGSIN